MRDAASWSINLGHCRGVQVRLHAFFLVFGVFTVYLSSRQGDQDLVWYGLAALAILLASVVVHELGHALAAFRMGGNVEEIVLGPLGGLVPPRVPREPQHELVMTLCGPAANLLVAALAAVPVLVHQGQFIELLHPFAPADLHVGTPWLIAAKLTFWINWVLFLVNVLLPVFPLDGGRIVHALIWKMFDQRMAVASVTLAGKVVAVLLCVAAWFARSEPAPALVPPWLPLLLLAIFVFFSAKHEAARLEEQDIEEELFSYDFSQGYTSLERHVDTAQSGPRSPLRRWVASRRQARQRRRQLVEQNEERQVDEILARLHQHGMQGLSPKERALLNRVSARYRNRQGS